jgi:hypothetical protein
MKPNEAQTQLLRAFVASWYPLRLFARPDSRVVRRRRASAPGRRPCGSWTCKRRCCMGARRPRRRREAHRMAVRRRSARSAPKDFAATRGWEAGLGVSAGDPHGRLMTQPPEFCPADRADGRSRQPRSIHAVEIGIKVSAGQNVSVIGRGPACAVDEVEREERAARAGGAVDPELGPDLYTHDPGAGERGSRPRILIRRRTPPAPVPKIESVRLVFRKEYLASVPSGVSWQGLSGSIVNRWWLERPNR